jgi:hypothetical protein
LRHRDDTSEAFSVLTDQVATSQGRAKEIQASTSIIESLGYRALCRPAESPIEINGDEFHALRVMKSVKILASAQILDIFNH